MQKYILIIMTVTMLAASSCYAAIPCMFPNSNMHAPQWICDPSDYNSEAVVSAIVKSEKSMGGISYMIEMAKSNARIELINALKYYVGNLLQRYAKSIGKENSATADKIISSVSIQIRSITGDRTFSNTMGPSGSLYLLQIIDQAAAQKIIEDAIRSSMKSDSVLWEEFQAGKSKEETIASIVKLINV